MPGQFDPVHLGHPDIRQQNIRRVALRDFQRASAVGGGRDAVDPVAAPGDHLPQAVPGDLFIVHDQ